MGGGDSVPLGCCPGSALSTPHGGHYPALLDLRKLASRPAHVHARARPRRGLHLAFALVVNGGSERGSSALRHPQGQVSSSAHALLSRAWPLQPCAPVPACGTPRRGGRGGLAGAAAGLILRALADHQRRGLGGRHVPEAGEGPCVLSHRRGGGKALGARFPRRRGPQLVDACHCPGEGLPCSHSSL